MRKLNRQHGKRANRRDYDLRQARRQSVQTRALRIKEVTA